MIIIIIIIYWSFCAGAINLASGKPVETDHEKDKEQTREITGEPIIWPS